MTTTHSLDIKQTLLSPYIPPQYLSRFIITTLQKRGFEGGEAGAIAEMERLLEHHVQDLFARAMDHANHAQRSRPNAADVLEAQSEGSIPLSRLRGAAKRRRRSIKLNITSEPPSEPHQTTLNDLHTHMSESSSVTTGKDEKPDLNKVEGEVLDYAYEGAPRLPGKWTFAHDYSNSINIKPEGPIQVTTASLDFVKSTATERGDISPDLGIVHYRRPGGKRKLGLQ